MSGAGSSSVGGVVMKKLPIFLVLALGCDPAVAPPAGSDDGTHQPDAGVPVPDAGTPSGESSSSGSSSSSDGQGSSDSSSSSSEGSGSSSSGDSSSSSSSDGDSGSSDGDSSSDEGLISDPGPDGYGPGLAPAAVPPASEDGVGAFRIQQCTVSHVNNDDPVVFPGSPGAAHLHMYIGNETVDAFTTKESLDAGTTTCTGGVRNMSSYWFPTMLNGAGEVQHPTEARIYYKAGYHEMDHRTVQPIPAGLKLIAGPGYAARWLQCGRNDGNQRTMTDCLNGETLEHRITFPTCWDGKNLDSPDHRSHVRYHNGRTCPSTHPVLIAELTITLFWRVNDPQGTAHWRLSSDDHHGGVPGSSAHADYWEGWKPGVAEVFVEHCIRRGLDCNNGNMGNGWMLVRP